MDRYRQLQRMENNYPNNPRVSRGMFGSAVQAFQKVVKRSLLAQGEAVGDIWRREQGNSFPSLKGAADGWNGKSKIADAQRILNTKIPSIAQTAAKGTSAG